MSILQRTIEAAMRDRAPKMHAELKAAGKLTAHVREIEEQVNSQVVSEVMEQRLANRWDRLPPMEMAAKMKAADALALETALAEALEFPPDPT
jgi:hypothetical protein